MAYHMGPATEVKSCEDRRVPHWTVGNPVCLHHEKQLGDARALPRRRVYPSAFFDDLGGYRPLDIFIRRDLHLRVPPKCVLVVTRRYHQRYYWW